MRVAITQPLFAWEALEDSPSLTTIRDLLAAIPDGRLLQSLHQARGKGRDDPLRGGDFGSSRSEAWKPNPTGSAGIPSEFFGERSCSPSPCAMPASKRVWENSPATEPCAN